MAEAFLGQLRTPEAFPPGTELYTCLEVCRAPQSRNLIAQLHSPSVSLRKSLVVKLENRESLA